MIRVNDLVADLKCHGSPCCGMDDGRPKTSRQFCQYTSPQAPKQSEMAEKSPLLGIWRRAFAVRRLLARLSWQLRNGMAEWTGRGTWRMEPEPFREPSESATPVSSDRS